MDSARLHVSKVTSAFDHDRRDLLSRVRNLARLDPVSAKGSLENSQFHDRVDERNHHLKQKIEHLTLELSEVKSRNKILLAKNVQLQKGSDSRLLPKENFLEPSDLTGHGSYVQEIRALLHSVQSRLDQQIEINKSLSNDRQIKPRALVPSMNSTDTTESRSSSTVIQRKLDACELQLMAFTMLSRALYSRLGRTITSDRGNVDQTFDKIHQDLCTELATLSRNRTVLEEDAGWIDDLWQDFFQSRSQHF